MVNILLKKSAQDIDNKNVMRKLATFQRKIMMILDFPTLKITLFQYGFSCYLKECQSKE